MKKYFLFGLITLIWMGCKEKASVWDLAYDYSKKSSDEYARVNHPLAKEDSLHLELALKYIDSAICYNPNFFNYHFGKANIMETTGNPEKVEQAYKKVIEVGQDVLDKMAEAYYEIGIIKDTTGSADSARYYYNRAIHLLYQSEQYKKNLGLRNRRMIIYMRYYLTNDKAAAKRELYAGLDTPAISRQELDDLRNEVEHIEYLQALDFPKGRASAKEK